MVNKGLMEELYKQGYGFEEIAWRVGISRQRVHQIITKYKNFGRDGRLKKYRDFGKCKNCQEQQAEVLHHLDFNNQNDELNNLEPLCTQCHIEKHKGRKRKMQPKMTIERLI